MALVYLTGFEHGLDPTTAGGGIADAVNSLGTFVIDVDAAWARSGGYGLKLGATGDGSANGVQVRKAIGSGQVGVYALYVTGADLPASGTSKFLELDEGLGTTYAQLWVDSSGGLHAMVGGDFGDGTVIDGPTITEGVRFRIDVRYSTPAGTYTLDWMVDGVAQTQASFSNGSLANSAGAKSILYEAENTDNTTSAFYFDDVLASLTSGDYPLNSGADYEVLAYQPNATGTPNYTATLTVPTVRAVGTIASGTGAISPGLPAGTVAGDLLLMFCESFRGEAVTASGWTVQQELSSGDDGGAGNTDTRLTVLSKIAAGGDATTTNDPGDHIVGRIVGVTAGTFDTNSPFDAFATITAEDVVDASASAPDFSTTKANCLVFTAIAAGNDPAANGTANFAAMVNANLSSITERIDNTRTDGNGGAIGVSTGTKATAGSVGATTCTLTVASYKVMTQFAIRPNPSPFRSAGTTITSPDGSTDHLLIDDLPFSASTGDRWNMVTADGDDYLEFGFEDGDNRPPIAVNALVELSSSASATACDIEARIRSSSTETVVFNGSPGSTSPVFKGAIVSPTGGSWGSDASVFNALLLRFGYSSDINPVPSLEAALLEAALPQISLIWQPAQPSLYGR